MSLNTPPWPRPSRLLLPALVLAAAGISARAEGVSLNRTRVEVRLGETCQFEAEQALGPGVAQPVFTWTLEDEAGHPAPPGAGSISPYGTYLAPAVLPGSTRVVVKATAGGDPRQTAIALVKLLPAAGSAGEPARRAPGVALLAGGDSEAAHLDSPIGSQARFAAPRDLVFAPRIPQAGGAELRDVWLVAEKGGVGLIFQDGRVRFFPAPKPARGPVEAFTRMALRPWSGPDGGPWELFLYGEKGACLYRMDGDGRFSPLELAAGSSAWPDRRRRPGAMVADRQGNLYLAVAETGEHPNQILRIAPDGGITVVAGGGTVPGHRKDAQGPLAGFAWVKGLALDEQEGTLYALDENLIRTIALGDGTVATLAKDVLPQQAELEGLAWHRERLVVAGHRPAALFVVNPATGKGAQAYEDGDALRRKPQAASQGLRRGPCLGADRDPLQKVSGSLGELFSEFAFGPGDRMAFRSGPAFGTLTLDWEALAPRTRPAGAGEPREEKKELPAPAAAAPAAVESKGAPAEADAPLDPFPERKTPAPGPGVGLAEVMGLPQIARLRPRAGLQIPNPPFSLRGLDPSRKMAAEVAVRWRARLGQELTPEVRAEWQKHLLNPHQDQLPARRYAIFHGIGMDSQRRLLQCFYENEKQFTPGEVFALSPWVVLGLRSVVSGTLIDLTRPSTWYKIGFLLEVPLECIYSTSAADAHIPMESVKAGYDQAEFRSRFLHDNPFPPEQQEAFEATVQRYLEEHKVGEHDWLARAQARTRLRPEFAASHQLVGQAYGPETSSKLLAPYQLLGEAHPEFGHLYNEVGCFTRISDPKRAVRITAVVLTSSGKYGNGTEGTDVKPDSFYETQARELAKRLQLPFYDLRRVKPAGAAGR